MGHVVDHYVEAQVHGPLRLAQDVEALVIDPVYSGTPHGDTLLATAARYGIAAEYHDGFVLPVSAVPTDKVEGPFRWQALCAGGHARAVAERVAGERGMLDAAVIGAAAPREERDHIKDLWVMTVALSRPRARARTARGTPPR
jgi:hypothetical protein